MSEKTFNFWCPLEITKAKDKDGKQTMRLGGIASTADKDSDGEYLDPNGFDLKPFIASGGINWHHGTKERPSTLIGEPHKAKITKEGLYLEADLYPSSKIAKEVYELAQVMEKDSTTRRLGFSIEGKVLERGSDDKNDPEYFNVKKAMITGCAITHMPKNPKTFADIIKGHVEEDEEEEDETEKCMDTSTGRPLIKESLNKKMKNTITKSQKVASFEKIFELFPGIEIQKAKNIYSLLTKIEEMKKSKTITDEQIEKAFGALGIAPTENIISKGDEDEDEDEDGNVKKGKDDEDEDDEDETDTSKKTKSTKKEKAPEMKKGSDSSAVSEEKKESAFSKLEKSFIDKINESNERSETLIKAVGTLLKKSLDETSFIKGELSETRDELKKAQETIEAISGVSTGRKSVTGTTSFKERDFNKGENDNDLEKGIKEGKVLRKSERTRVLDLLDVCTFEKGYDADFAKAMTSFESSGILNDNIVQRIRTEKGITIVG